MPQHLIVFVCTGNICRSPMAEYMLKARLSHAPEWSVCSAGTLAGEGMRATPAAVEATCELGMDISSHRSQMLSRELVDAASLIVVMSGSHSAQIQSLYPGAQEKVFLLKSFDPNSDGDDVNDPIGLPVDAYRDISREIGAALPGLVDFLNSLRL